MDMNFVDIKFVANLLYYINFKTFPFRECLSEADIKTWASNYIPLIRRDVMTYPCPWCLLLAQHSSNQNPGAVSIKGCRLTSIGIPVLKIRRSCDRLIFNMGIPIPGKDGLYIETGPRFPIIHISDDHDGGCTADNSFESIYFGKHI